MFQFTSSSAVNAALALLLLFSLATWTLIFAKGWLQWKLRQQNHEFGRDFWKAVDLTAARGVAERSQGNLAGIARQGFDTLNEIGTQKTIESLGDRQAAMERSLAQQVRREQHRLESGLMLLASIGSTAPFVGLFGTVWGIMGAMQGIAANGSAGLEVVAGPVGEALMSTAIGIAAAIPAVLAYNYGVRVTRLAVADMDRFAHDFIRLVSQPKEA